MVFGRRSMAPNFAVAAGESHLQRDATSCQEHLDLHNRSDSVGRRTDTQYVCVCVCVCVCRQCS